MSHDPNHGDPRTESSGEEPVALDERTARLLAGAASRHSLPPGLRARLLALPHGAEAEDEDSRRFERARAAGLEAAATGLPPVLSADACLPQPRTARAIAHWVADARRPARLPEALRARLLTLGRGIRKPLPFWLVDPRWAAAACLLLTLVSTLLVGEASALLGEQVAEVKVRRQEWQVIAAEKVSATFEDAGHGLIELWYRGQDTFSSRVEGVRDLYEEKLRQFNQTELGRLLAGEPSKRGVSDGK